LRGYKDKNKKFHPISETKGVRKSRDQKAKQKGVKIQTGIRKARFTEDDKRILTGVIDDFNDLIEELDNFKAIDNNEKQNLERTNQILREVRDKRLDKLDKPEIESDFRV